MAAIEYYATGRRKTSTARVFLRPGTGAITVNHREFERYFPTDQLRTQVRRPLLLTETGEKFDILATVAGGGVNGQAGAIRLGIARALFAQVLVAWRQGDVDEAMMLLEESRTHFLTAHDTVGPSLCLIVQAILARYGGQFQLSLQLLTEAASLAAFEEFLWGVGIAHYYEGEVQVDRGDYQAALSAYRECLQSARRLHDLWTVGVAVDGIATIWALQNDPARAARLFGAADRLRGTTSALIPVIDRQLHARVIATVRAHLGAGSFSVAYDAGAALSPDEVIGEAMGDVRITGDRPAAIELTRRERDVLRLLIEGRTDIEVARELKLSKRTVSQHVSKMLEKSGSETRTALAVYAVRSSLA